jgi:hypothetical protein
MKDGVHVYTNLLWDILDQESKLFIITLLIENNFDGECKLTSIIDGETTIIEVTDTFGHSMILPINILDILND